MADTEGTIEGVAVRTFPLAGKGQQVQIALPGESSYVNLHPESAAVLGRMIMTAAQRAKGSGDTGRVVLGSTANADRRAKVWEYYRLACLIGHDVPDADTLPEEAVNAVRELRAIALSDHGPLLGGVHLNPRITRRYALEALAWLALDGWGIGPIDEPAYIRPPDSTLFLIEARPMEEVFLTASVDDKAVDALT